MDVPLLCGLHLSLRNPEGFARHVRDQKHPALYGFSQLLLRCRLLLDGEAMGRTNWPGSTLRRTAHLVFLLPLQKALHKFCVELTRAKLIIGKDSLVQRNRRMNSLNHELA